MNIWKTTLLLVLLFTGITVHAQKVKISLNSDGNLTIWKVKAQAEIEHPSDMMTTRYDTRDWVKATVPGTVFGSYVLEGLEPDPNFADNAYKVDKAKYDRNFWYRTEFNSPEVENGERVWLNFEGVNRKGEIFFNGTRLGLLDGFMHRGNFDITDLLSECACRPCALGRHSGSQLCKSYLYVMCRLGLDALCSRSFDWYY